jgi:hypothetical protein
VTPCLSHFRKDHNGYSDCQIFWRNGCIFEEEEEEPTGCYLVLYYTYERLNVFRAALCPSSGAHEYISEYHMDRLILRLLMVWRLGAGWLSKCPG